MPIRTPSPIPTPAASRPTPTPTRDETPNIGEPPAHPAPLAESWAEVHARDAVVRYRRSGAGPLVLLVAPEGAAGPFWPGLVDELAGRFRVVTPALATGDGGTSTASQLCAFLEGMGAAGARVLAAGRLCIPALELAMRDMDQVARLVLVSDAGADDRPSDGMLLTSTRSATIPLLVASRRLPPAEAIPLVVRFLLEGETRS